MEKLTRTYGSDFVLWLVLGSLFIIPGVTWQAPAEPVIRLESAVTTPPRVLPEAAQRMRDVLLRGPLPHPAASWVSVP